MFDPCNGHDANIDFSGRNLAWKVKHLRRAPCEKFQPVVVNPWISAEGVPSNHNQLPWIPGDRQHQPIEINDDAEDSADQHEQAIVVDQDDDMEEDFTEIDGEGTQLNNSPYNIGKDNDSTLTTQQSIDEPDDTVLLNTVTAETVQDVRSLSIDDDDVAMQDVLEQNDSSAGSSTPNNTDNDKPTQPTYPDNEEDPNIAPDDKGRTNWCICNGEYTGSIMIECKNCEDPDCKGKWYHITCVGLARPPAKNVDWYCEDCRKKLKLGVYSNGCVAQSRKPNQATGRTRRR